MHRHFPETIARLEQGPTRPPVFLHEALAGDEIPSPCGGRAWLITRQADGLVNEAGAIRKRLQRRLAPGSEVHQRLTALARREDLGPHHLLFLDIETTGLSNAPLFLIGTLECQPGGLLVRQYFARDYSEESAVTSLFLDQLTRDHVLVSFNGRTFDLRYIRERAAVHGLRCRFPQPHLDLLHWSRRAWKFQLPNCRLQTLEQCICKRLRHGDIPGHLIPEAYHSYVRTGDATEMVQVIEHNLLDLLTMADLLARLPGPG